MKKILVLVVDGNEPVEVITPTDLLRRAGNKVVLASVKNSETVKLTVGEDKDIVIKVDAKLGDIKLEDFDAVFLPGGEGHVEYLSNPKVKEVLDNFVSRNKLVSAICASGGVLGKLGFLTGKKGTCYPGYEMGENVNYTGESVVTSGNIITGKGPGAAYVFGLELISFLNGKKTSENISKGTMRSN